MRDFISRTDAIFRLRRRQMDDDETYHNIDYHKTWDDAISVVKHLSCPDVVPVVRCQECRWGNKTSKEGIYYHCGNPYEQTGEVHPPNWYCPVGKRKEDTHNDAD